MKPFSNVAAFVLAQLDRALQSLRASPGGWRPKPAPVLVPIPIRAEQRDRSAARRLPHRSG